MCPKLGSAASSIPTPRFVIALHSSFYARGRRICATASGAVNASAINAVPIQHPTQTVDIRRRDWLVSCTAANHVRGLQHLIRSLRRRGQGTSTKPGAVGLPNHAHNGKVSAGTCDASRPTPNARAVGRQEPLCSASTSAAHAASRSAKTSPGAARNIATVCPSSISSALDRNPRIPGPQSISLTPAIPKESWQIAARLCENRGQPRPERGGCLAFGRAACIARRSSKEIKVRSGCAP